MQHVFLPHSLDSCKWGTRVWRCQSSISCVGGERTAEKRRPVSLHVVCVCCACGAAFTGAYGGFAYWAKSWPSYLPRSLISSTIIANFQSRLFASSGETPPDPPACCWQPVHSDFPSKLKRKRKEKTKKERKKTTPPPRWYTHTHT